MINYLYLAGSSNSTTGSESSQHNQAKRRYSPMLSANKDRPGKVKTGYKRIIYSVWSLNLALGNTNAAECQNGHD